MPREKTCIGQFNMNFAKYSVIKLHLNNLKTQYVLDYSKFVSVHDSLKINLYIESKLVDKKSQKV